MRLEAIGGCVEVSARVPTTPIGESKIFGYIGPHAKLWKPRTTFAKSPPLSNQKFHRAGKGGVTNKISSGES